MSRNSRKYGIWLKDSLSSQFVCQMLTPFFHRALSPSLITGSQCRVLVYVALERYANTGDADVGFWILQNPSVGCAGGSFTGTHQTGDLLIVAEFTKGGVIKTIKVYQWVGSAKSWPA
jgi:hypothetical protein